MGFYTGTQKKSMEKRSYLKTPHVWSSTIYFAEGLPYTIIRIVSPVFFRDMRVSLEAIGLTSLFGIPWVIKFLWAPIIDQFGTKRRWMLLAQFFLALLFIIIGFISPMPWGIKAIAFMLLVAALLSATQDISIDGYYMEALNEKAQARFVGYRVMTYRIAMMTGTGIIVTIGATLNWFSAFSAAGIFLFLLFLFHFFFLPIVEIEKASILELLNIRLWTKFLIWSFAILIILAGIKLFIWETLSSGLFRTMPYLKGISIPGLIALALLLSLILLALFRDRLKNLIFKDKESFYSRAFYDYINRDHMSVAIAFIILMRTGESALSCMVAPFMVDLGLKVHFGWLSGAIGLPFSIIGALTGGFFISRLSLKKIMWPFLLAQNLTNLVYAALALHLKDYVILNTGAETTTYIGNLNLFIVAIVHAFDQFAGGLGTSILMVFLMRTCTDQFKAAHYAIGSGLMNISAVFAGVASGFLAERLGYGLFFGFTFLLSIPGMCLICYIPFLEDNK